MGNFAIALSRATGVMCGVMLDRVGFVKGDELLSELGTMTIERSDVSARELLDEAVRQAPEYLWRPAGGNRVNILPVVESGDPNSFINKPIPSFTADNVPLSLVIRRLSERSADTDYPIRRFMPVGVGRRNDAERAVAFVVEDGTLLDVLNAAFNAAGDNVAWSLDWVTLVYSRIPLSKVETVALARAEQYLERPARERAEAVQLFERALASAPYEPFRAAVRVRLATVHAGLGFPGGLPRWDLFTPDALAALVEDAHTADERDAAHGVLLALLDSPHRPTNLGEQVLIPLLVEVDRHERPYDSLMALKRRLSDTPSHPAYAQAIEAAIARLEPAAQSEEDVCPIHEMPQGRDQTNGMGKRALVAAAAATIVLVAVAGAALKLLGWGRVRSDDAGVE
jgi:hypothetical protein